MLGCILRDPLDVVASGNADISPSNHLPSHVDDAFWMSRLWPTLINGQILDAEGTSAHDSVQKSNCGGLPFQDDLRGCLEEHRAILMSLVGLVFAEPPHHVGRCCSCTAEVDYNVAKIHPLEESWDRVDRPNNVSPSFTEASG